MHEIGHSLGLSHSQQEDSIMYSFYQYDLAPELSYDDILAVQSIYGLCRSLMLYLLQTVNSSKHTKCFSGILLVYYGVCIETNYLYSLGLYSLAHLFALFSSASRFSSFIHSPSPVQVQGSDPLPTFYNSGSG